MGTAPKTRHLWIMQCAQRYEEVLGLAAADAQCCASQCATAQDDAYGSAMEHWMSPANAADVDIESWDRDEREEPLATTEW